MRSKNQKSHCHQFSLLTPWETDVDDPCINKYCSDYVSKYNIHTEIRKDTNLPKINAKKRAVSNCNTHSKAEPLFSHEKTSYNKTHYQSQAENYQQTFHTLSQHRADRVEKKKTESRGPLQQLSVKNFIIEGGHAAANQKEKLRKRQSSYIMKQKFTEFRRSLKTIEQNKENAHVRVIRYQC